jgi:hypothetical protein
MRRPLLDSLLKTIIEKGKHLENRHHEQPFKSGLR